MKLYLQKIAQTFFIAFMGGLLALGMNSWFDKSKKEHQKLSTDQSFFKFTRNTNYPDFIEAAENSVHCVVHIKTTYSTSEKPLLNYFFGDESPEALNDLLKASGSGVIISADGYIVTNNHVIEKTKEIEVVLNDKRSFKAHLIGTDPCTDIALVKIDAQDLPFIKVGDSDAIRIGEWVLAVGNPLNLTSTVTAGIISAKGRNINLLEEKLAIESFIQTDAAVNPGNSGGALVNQKGELIGINTAIASQTDFFTGYSFAVPSNIMSKVINDIKEFGQVQRAMLGVNILDVDADLAKEKNLEKIEGVFVSKVQENGSADEAGIEENDIIIQIANVSINNVSQLQEQINNYRPGQKVAITLKHNGEIKKVEVLLKNKDGNTALVNSEVSSTLGASFKLISQDDKERLKVKNGVQITDISVGKLSNKGVRKGFIITEINGKEILKTEDIYDIIKNSTSVILIKGMYPDGTREYYAFGK